MCQRAGCDRRELEDYIVTTPFLMGRILTLPPVSH
jgi:hypothetical protein